MDYRKEIGQEMKTQFRTDNTATGTGTGTPLDHETTINWIDHLTVHDQETPTTNTHQQIANTGHVHEISNKPGTTDIDKNWKGGLCHETDLR